jgi:hypothetical protein
MDKIKKESREHENNIIRWKDVNEILMNIFDVEEGNELNRIIPDLKDRVKELR